jgi:outer membrane PBP1 activator LpoA protein
MISLRQIVPAVLFAAALAGCFTYFVSPSSQVEADKLPRQPLAYHTEGTPLSAEERGDAFQQAAEAILKQAPDTQASTITNQRLITGRIPLPRRRPIARP